MNDANTEKKLSMGNRDINMVIWNNKVGVRFDELGRFYVSTKIDQILI